MANFFDKLKAVNSAARTLLVAVFAGGLGYGGWLGYENYVKPGLDARQALADYEELRIEHEKQSELLKNVERQRDQLALAKKLLTIDKRLARVKILDTGHSDEGEPYTKVRFYEVNEQGAAIKPPREFTLNGKQVFIDGWVVKFLDEYVEGADSLRNCSLCVFKRIYGDKNRPADGFPLDNPSDSSVPGIYSDDEEKNEFEQQIWSDFWSVSNDTAAQESLGIRAAHGNAIYIEAVKGKTYEIALRASGATAIRPIGQPSVDDLDASE